MTPHSSTLAWKTPWMEEPGGLQSMGSLRVGHDWATEQLHFSLSCIGKGNGNPLQCSCLENPRDGGAWWAALYGVAQSQTWLKQLSSNSRVGCHFPPPGDIPDLGIEPASAALAGRFFTPEPPVKPFFYLRYFLLHEIQNRKIFTICVMYIN